MLLVLYLAAGGLMFVRPVQESVAGWYFKARRPTAQEQARINTVWAPVARSAGVAPAHYVMRVEESDDLNASAAGGHVITLTTTALAELTDENLSSVLAHELGHHLGMHTVISTIANWLLLPINLLFLLGELGAHVLTVISRVSRVFGNGPVALIAGLFSLLARLYLWVFSLFVRLALACLTVVGRRSEFEADATAVRLGFGPGLLDALRHFQAEEGTATKSTQRTLREVMGDSHPRTADRIARIQTMISDS